jgi:xylulokinase
MYLGLDIGTTATKAVLVDEHHAIVATATAGYSLYQPTPEISEFDPQAWIDAVRLVVAALRAEKPAALQAVRAIGLSGQIHSLVALDAEGHPVCPAILWNDGRGVTEARRLREGLPGIGELTGVLPMASFTAAKLLWLKDHRPEVFARIKHILWVKDFVRHWLTGEFVTDVSDAAGSQLLDTSTSKTDAGLRPWWSTSASLQRVCRVC